MHENHSTSGAVSKRKQSTCNFNVILDIFHHKQTGECARDIACVLQIPEMMIHTILKNVQETETKALNLLKHPEMKIHTKAVM
jgi:hypothetical protein